MAHKLATGVLASLSLLLLAALAQGLQVCPSLSCPTSSGFFAHPTDCGSYVQCSGGEVVIKNCPVGLHFHPVLHRCDYPSLVQCNITARQQKSGCALKVVGTATLFQLHGSSSSAVNCDCDCCLKPHDVCTMYYECNEVGQALERECSDGLVFNPAIENCDFASNYQCPTKAPPVCQCDCRYPVEDECNAYYDCRSGEPEKKYCPEGLFFNPETDMCGLHCLQTSPHPSPSPTTTTTPRPSFPCVDCSSSQQFFQHPSDCTKYIQCSPSGPWEMPCPNNKVWDQSILGCNLAETTPCVTGNYVDADGNCIQPSTTTTTTTTTTPTTTTATTPSTTTTTTPTTTTSTTSTTPRPTFPCVDCSSDQQFFQHPSDCTKYIQCSPSGPWEMPCPNNKVWDQSILGCNLAETTPCVTGNYVDADGNCIQPSTTTTSTTTTPRPSTDTTSTTTTTPKAPSTTSSDSGCDVVCPAPVGLFPHPRTCSEWVHCDHNIPYVKDCPGGLHFNTHLKVCDWPDNAGCTSGPDHNCEIPTPAPTTPSPNATVPTPNPVCDCQCCHKPKDCTAYYYCDENYSLSYYECSEGLVFHPDLGTCVYEDMYPECATTTELPPTCLCDCFYPSEVCSSYYNCIEGQPIKFNCPTGLYWNQEKKTCDLPQYVNCTMPARRRRH